MRNIDEPKSFNCSLYSKTRKEYLIEVNRWTNQRLIKQNNGPIDQLSKQFIEMIIRDILHSNPKLEDYNGLFVLTTKKRRIETDKVSIQFYPGFTTSFVETDSGNYLNVTLKNKIIQSETIYEFLYQYKDK